MPDARTFLYRYDGRNASEEEEIDFAGIRQIPQMGDLIYRKQMMWRVTGVYTGYGTSIPRYRVVLTHSSKTLSCINADPRGQKAVAPNPMIKASVKRAK